MTSRLRRSKRPWRPLQATLDESSAKLETVTAEAYDEILPTAQDVLARAQSGEDFDSLIETYGQDTGMNNEPNKSRGYLVCDGLSVYEQSFQDAAMALEKVGDVSAELVKTSYGYHILQYATDIAAGEVEYTDEIKSNIYDTMLSDAKDAAYEAAVTQWVSEAKVTTDLEGHEVISVRSDNGGRSHRTVRRPLLIYGKRRKTASMRRNRITARAFAQNRGKSSGGVRMKRKQKARCAASGSAEVGG